MAISLEPYELNLCYLVSRGDGVLGASCGLHVVGQGFIHSWSSGGGGQHAMLERLRVASEPPLLRRKNRVLILQTPLHYELMLVRAARPGNARTAGRSAFSVELSNPCVKLIQSLLITLCLWFLSLLWIYEDAQSGNNSADLPKHKVTKIASDRRNLFRHPKLLATRSSWESIPGTVLIYYQVIMHVWLCYCTNLHRPRMWPALWNSFKETVQTFWCEVQVKHYKQSCSVKWLTK